MTDGGTQTPATSSLFTARIRATALAVLNKESDAWTTTEWSKAAIDLASAVVAAAGDIDKIEFGNGADDD